MVNLYDDTVIRPGPAYFAGQFKSKAAGIDKIVELCHKQSGISKKLLKKNLRDEYDVNTGYPKIQFIFEYRTKNGICRYDGWLYETIDNCCGNCKYCYTDGTYPPRKCMVGEPWHIELCPNYVYAKGKWVKSLIMEKNNKENVKETKL